ncbi:MAG: TerB family tellurite resistance protein [Cytophagales bacterium]|nr:TerB family tellurite resistance protein [Bernardetiaceae bacterium]MDW8204245.1 TerB family tellurite resistance protein [Cytophagales bacterium]
MLLSWAATAQRPLDRSEIEKIRMSIIQERLQLTPEQAKAFIPLLNRYRKEQLELRQQIMKLRRKSLVMTDEDLRKAMEQEFDLREKELALARKYHKEFLAVLNVRQVAELYQSELEFKRLLVERIGRTRALPDEID